MKFRAIISHQQYMREFQSTIITLSKLTRECVMIMSSDKVHFIINEESSSSAPLVWTEISCDAYFNGYIMEGLDAEHPNILLTFNPANMARALTALRNVVNYVKIKLTNKQFPCLTIDIDIPSNASIQTRHIGHDVPVNLIPQREWDLFHLPNLPESRVTLSMSNLRFIKNLIEKLKGISPSITFYANDHGELSVIAETDCAKLATHFRNLTVRKVKRLPQDNIAAIRNNEDGNDDDDNAGQQKNNQIEVSCIVDCKKTGIFLSSLQSQSSELRFGIIQDHLIHMEIDFRKEMIMHCLIPAICVQ